MTDTARQGLPLRQGRREAREVRAAERREVREVQAAERREVREVLAAERREVREVQAAHSRAVSSFRALRSRTGRRPAGIIFRTAAAAMAIKADRSITGGE